MAILSTTATVAAILGSATYILRRRISKSWIDLRRKKFELSGKTIIITGGNVGLGYETAKDLARRNGNIVIACRNIQKGQEAVQSISNETGNKNVAFLPLDLASIASVKEFISQVKTNYDSIDALVCNAGVWVPMEQKMKTIDMYEIHFGVNHLAHYLIAKSLVPLLEKSANNDGRIIFVSSSLMKQGKIDLQAAAYEGRSVGVTSDENGNPPKKSFAPVAYCDSKLMNALTCNYMAMHLPSSVTTYSVCPGFCRTSLGRHESFPFFMKIIVGPIMLMIQRTQTQGAQNIIFVTGTKKQDLKSGSMYRDGEIMKDLMDYMESVGGDVVAKQVLDFSEEMLEKH